MVSVVSVLQVLVVKMVLSRKAAEAAGIQLPEFPKQMGGLDSIARAGAPLQLQDHPKKDSDFDSESDSDLDFQDTGSPMRIGTQATEAPAELEPAKPAEEAPLDPNDPFDMISQAPKIASMLAANGDGDEDPASEDDDTTAPAGTQDPWIRPDGSRKRLLPIVRGRIQKVGQKFWFSETVQHAGVKKTIAHVVVSTVLDEAPYEVALDGSEKPLDSYDLVAEKVNDLVLKKLYVETTDILDTESKKKGRCRKLAKLTTGKDLMRLVELWILDPARHELDSHSYDFVRDLDQVCFLI